MKNLILEDLQWRGLVSQCTDLETLTSALNLGKITLYSGFDPSAPSLHVGNLVPLITLARFQLGGHRVLALVGGATGLIGDPSGKSQERVMQTSDDVAKRALLVARQLASVVDVSNPDSGAVVNNLSWTESVTVLDFLRDIGKHFSVSAMIQRDSVRSRLDRAGEGMSFTEFSYMLLQGFDFLKLAELEGCSLQIGGSDQWGNMCSGIDLIRRKLGKEAVALTLPLLTTINGEKFGKTVKGAVWLDAKLTSPWDFYQFWLNSTDADVVRLLKLFTFVSRAEIEELAEAVVSRPGLREAQRRLAFEMTVLVHGELETQQLVQAVEVIFGNGDVLALSEAAICSLAAAVPVLAVTRSEVLVLNRLLVQSNLETSLTKANAAIGQGGVSLNNEKQSDALRAMVDSDWLHGRFLLLKKGKKAFVLVERV